MSAEHGRIYLARHGETEWSLASKHTGRTDLPLTARGEQNARSLGDRLRGMTFTKVYTSPLVRASRTCELAGFGGVAERDDDLVEWDYGQYEGMKNVEIQKIRPGWVVFRDGCPGGESPAQVAERADRVVARLRALEGDVLLFSSGHFLRVLLCRWLGLEPACGTLFLLSTASLSILGYNHNRNEPAMQTWNDTSHIR